MKRLLSYLFVAMVFLSCLRQPEPVVEPQPLPISCDVELMAIDSLMQHDADSALVCLTSFRPTEGSGEISSTFNANYQALLTSEALYKTYNPQYYRNELQSAMRFFDSISVQYPYNDDIMMLSARSHYMNGVGYYESDSVIEACKEYLKTLEIMEDHFEEKQLVGYRAKFMSYAYSHLGTLFSAQYMMENAIDCYKNALYYCEIEPTSKYGVSKLLSIIGNQYDKMNDKNSALYYYKKALVGLTDHDNLTYRNIISELALLNYHFGGNPQIALDSLKTMARLTDKRNEKVTRYLTIGYIYYKENTYDSAQLYLIPVFEHSNDISVRIQAAEFLYEISNYYQKANEAINYTQFLAANKQIESDGKALVSKLNDLYQKFIHNKTERKIFVEKRLERQRMVSVVIPISVFVILVVLLIIYLYSRKHIAKHKAVLKTTQESLSEIKMKIKVKQFTDEPICQHILNIVNEHQFKSKIDYKNYKEFALGNEQIMELRTAVNLHYDSFTIRLKDKFPELTNDDIDYCCLYLLGLKDSDVSALMQKEYSTIRYRRSKIKTILNTDNNLTEALYNLTRLSNTIH